MMKSISMPVYGSFCVAVTDASTRPGLEVLASNLPIDIALKGLYSSFLRAAMAPSS